MRISPRLRLWLIGLVLLVVVFFAAFLWLRPLLHIGSGYAAKHACSCHFLQDRELAEISTHDLNFSVLGFISLSKQDQEIRSSFLGLVPRKAVFREGVGCTLINDESKDLVEVQGADAGAKNRDESAVVTGPAALAEALDFGMAPVPGGEARGLVIMQGGSIIAERYAPGYDQHTRLLGWSMTKTLTAMLLGQALQQTSPAPAATPAAAPAAAPEKLTARNHLFPEVWTDSARAEITIADLLHMNSGLAWNEAYGSLSDATIMLHEHADMAKYAYSAPAVAARNTTWSYSSGTTNILTLLADQELPDLTIQQQFSALYADIAPSLLFEPSQSGLPVGSSYGWATARDWANLGQFMLQNGVWNGDTLLAPGWIDYLQQPAIGSDETYGAQTWLPGPDMPSLPKDAFMMRGFQDQRVFIIPSRNMVIARLGHGVDKSTDFDGLVSRIIELDAIEK
jgi:CubicO group peptidase (beta-lactamase class C family)